MSTSGSNPFSKLEGLNVFNRAKEEVGTLVDTVRSVTDETKEKAPKVFEKLKEEFGGILVKAKNGTSGEVNELMGQTKGGIRAVSDIIYSKKEELEATVEKTIEEVKERKSGGTSIIDEHAPIAERITDVVERVTKTNPEEGIWGLFAKLFEKFCSPTKRD
ncbi:uncharacterized protein [Typha angustifolia]|uniref:uncharacterized protein n=1 Tax=Typha angustifolia TaxID=59011 RepID=UPI003C2DDF37